MAYLHQQRSCANKYFFISGSLALAGIIGSYIAAGITNDWIIVSYTAGLWGMASFLFVSSMYKYLTIRDKNEDSLHIEWDKMNTTNHIYSTTIKYKDILYFKHTTSNTDCCNPIGDTVCCHTLIYNANGCGPGCSCCNYCCGGNGTCDNLDMIEIGLKQNTNYKFNGCHCTKYHCCYNQCYDQSFIKLRISTDDYNDLAQFLRSKGIKEKDVGIGGRDNAVGSKLLSVNVRSDAKDQSAYRSVDDINPL